MNLKLGLGVGLPLILVILLAALSNSNIGLTVEDDTLGAIGFESLFVADREQGSNIAVKTITVTNDFFMPRRFELPRIVACLVDKEGTQSWTQLSVQYSEGTYSAGADVPIFDDILYNYNPFSRTGVDIPANTRKQIKVIIKPQYVYNYQASIKSKISFDEVVIAEPSRSSGRSCYNINSEDMENADHILIVNIPDPSTITSCKDTDGKDYYRKGTVTFFDQNQGRDGKVEDFCESGSNRLGEQYCQGDNRLVDYFSCPKGCSNGACIR